MYYAVKIEFIKIPQPDLKKVCKRIIKTRTNNYRFYDLKPTLSQATTNIFKDFQSFPKLWVTESLLFFLLRFAGDVSCAPSQCRFIVFPLFKYERSCYLTNFRIFLGFIRWISRFNWGVCTVLSPRIHKSCAVTFPHTLDSLEKAISSKPTT